ncbi:PQ loop repeat-domain-containing protein [Protomyces lactucae-debilis]|uniref:PQ loop repeat-domain-containing protein n=1 Tax=Protomyces lactucae-debilis TaxID=2754530 RepID=A0A1Y2FB70_PROLT|nr:PQ loop repeat-domain-containing protein [Protomyces lactucae-debilis]ORY80877.1 PQ loop repeat-domain-containing protein [Protomyces lactucae-debilis]
MGGYDIVSGILGWTYFAAWSVSFYPQVLLNFQRKSVTGVSIDYLWLNVAGFCCYSSFCVMFLASDDIKDAYKQRNPGSSGALVRINDAVFALHALVISSITLSQAYLWGYKKDRDQHTSTICRGFLTGVIVSAISLISIAQMTDKLEWIDVLYGLSYCKLLVTVYKYMPQLYLNFERKSTRGFSIVNVLLDFTGGALSSLQLVLDSAVSGDWSAITGDIVKFGLGLLSMFFDTLLMLQHYCVYGENPFADEDEDAPLLPDPR